MVGGEDSLNQDFMGNELFQSINTLGTYKGAVDFFSDTDSYTSGFTKDFSVVHDNTIPTDLSTITKYDISTYYTDEELTFSGITQGIPSPGLSQYSAGLESQFTSTALGGDGDVSWNLKIGAAGLGDTLPPYTLEQLQTSLPSMTTDGTYLGEVNFISNTDSYTSGFTKNFSVVHDLSLKHI